MKHATFARVVSRRQRRRWEVQISEEDKRGNQDEESFHVNVDGRVRALRLHDYAELYKLPGLYEQIVYERLRCRTPWRLVGLLRRVLRDWRVDPSELRALDLGAGNGIVAERLRAMGVGYIAGVDILPEAEMAARRDRPEAYDDYLVADFTALEEGQQSKLEEEDLNCLVSAAALGFGDIPPAAFAQSLALIDVGGTLAVSIKDSFLINHADSSGFAQLIRRLMSSGVIEVHAWHRHHHRLSLAGEPLFYIALVGRKQRAMPKELLDGLI